MSVIVYVEDNPNNQRLMQKMLGRRGMRVQVCDSAEEGLRLIRELQPSLVFVDVHLKSRSTGMDLVRWLRMEGFTVPIVAVTVFSMLADRDKALSLGCNDYLSKPYNMSQLDQIVDKYIGTNVN